VNLKLWKCTCFSAFATFIVGCQSYEPVPLDIDTHRSSLDTRLFHIEPLSAFVERLDVLRDGDPTNFDFSDGISPSEGEVIALFYNPELRIARLRAGASLAEFDTAGLWEDPVFGYDGVDITSPSAPFEFSIMGNITIPISGRLSAEKERAGAAYEAQLRTIVDAEWQTRAALRSHWAKWAASTERVALIDEVIAQLQKINAIADTLVAAGELNRVQHRLLQVELSSKMVEATEIELQVLEASFDLLDVMGLSPEAASMLIPTFPALELPHVEDETARLIDTNTLLAVRFAEYETAEKSLHVEIKKQFPDIVLGSGYGSEFNDHRVMFGLSIPLPVINANKAGIAIASANREVARATAETTFAHLYRELAAASITLQLKQSQRDHYEKTIVPMLEDQTRDIEKIVELGEVDTFILLETVTRQFDAKQQLIALQLAELDAVINVIRIYGPDSQMNPSPVHKEISTERTLGGVQ
jgi:outer membrane protein TolC